jgi:uncharacterized protein
VEGSKKFLLPSSLDLLPKYESEFLARGFFEWRATVAGEPVVGIIRREDMDRFVLWDTSHVREHFPLGTHVLTIHGLADQTVPPYVFSPLLKI